MTLFGHERRRPRARQPAHPNALKFLDRLDKMLKHYMAKLLRTLDPADLQPALKTLLDGMGRWTTRSTRAT